MGSAKAGLVGLINGLIFLDNDTVGPEEGLVPKDEVGVDASQGQVLDDHVVGPISFVIDGEPEGKVGSLISTLSLVTCTSLIDYFSCIACIISDNNDNNSSSGISNVSSSAFS